MMDNAMPRPRLAQLEALDADGRVAQAWDVHAWPLRLGRALDNDIVLPDAHLAAHHARVEADADGRLILHALPSRNGLRIGAGPSTQLLAAGQAATLPVLATWHAGSHSLRLRRAEDPLDDELPLAAAPGGRAPRRTILLLLAALMAWMFGALWIENNPASTWEAYLPPLLGVLGGLLLWAALWGLASKLFTRRFAMGPHLGVVLTFGLAIAVIETLLGLLAYMLDWPWLSRIREPLLWLVVAAMLAQHLRLVVPAHPRAVRFGVAGLAMLALGWAAALQWQRNDRLLDEFYLATLPPPSWRLAPAQPPAALIDRLRTLEAPLAETARKAAAKEIDP